MAKKREAIRTPVAKTVTNTRPATTNKQQRTKPVNFDKYSPREYAALWNLSKREIIQDILNRNGVERRKVSDPRPFQYKEPNVRVIARTVRSGKSVSRWFYLRIEGFAPFTTKIRMDIDSPDDNGLGKAGSGWWEKSQYAQLLGVELRSAKAFVSQTRSANQMKKAFPPLHQSPVQFLLAALEDWGFHDFIDALEFDEIGPDRLYHFCNTYFRRTKELEDRFNSHLQAKVADSIEKTVMDSLTIVVKDDEATVVTDERSVKVAEDEAMREIRRRNCIEWKPDIPIDWNPKTRTGWRLSPDMSRMGDVRVLSNRFQLRYPNVAERIREVIIGST